MYVAEGAALWPLAPEAAVESPRHRSEGNSASAGAILGCLPVAAMNLFGSSSLPDVFPEVRAADLDGTELTLPADLPAPVVLIIVSFQDELDPLADQWARLGHQIETHFPDRFAVIETPVVGRGMKLFGDLATLGIRGQVEDDQERARTVPIYVDRKPFRKALKLSKTGDVYPFLVERDSGRILWGGRGEIDMDEVQSLEEEVARAVRSLPSTDNAPEAAPPEASGAADVDAGPSPPDASGESPAAR